MVNNLINEAKLLTEMSIKGNLSQISHKHLFMILISKFLLLKELIIKKDSKNNTLYYSVSFYHTSNIFFYL